MISVRKWVVRMDVCLMAGTLDRGQYYLFDGVFCPHVLTGTGSGPICNEKGSPRALESGELNCQSLFSIHFFLGFLAFCCLLFALSFYHTDLCTCTFSHNSSTRTITQLRM